MIGIAVALAAAARAARPRACAGPRRAASGCDRRRDARPGHEGDHRAHASRPPRRLRRRSQDRPGQLLRRLAHRWPGRRRAGRGGLADRRLQPPRDPVRQLDRLPAARARGPRGPVPAHGRRVAAASRAEHRRDGRGIARRPGRPAPATLPRGERACRAPGPAVAARPQPVVGVRRPRPCGALAVPLRHAHPVTGQASGGCVSSGCCSLRSASCS